MPSLPTCIAGLGMLLWRFDGDFRLRVFDRHSVGHPLGRLSTLTAVPWPVSGEVLGRAWSLAWALLIADFLNAEISYL